jgi:hypothetical protein
VFFVAVLGLASSASALVVSGFQEWTQRTDLDDLEGLEITSTGHARFTDRVDHDATDLIIHPGGLMETLGEYKMPDGRPQPLLTNAYVYGTWNAYEIQSFGVDRAAYIYIGAEGEINISNNGSGATDNPLAWLDEAQLGGRSLFLAPELNPEVWSIQIEDLGGGAWRITASGPPPGAAGNPYPKVGATDVPRDVLLSWASGPYASAINGHIVYLSDSFNDVNDGINGITVSDNSYSPDQRLELGTMYYWRVDEVNGVDFTVYPGDVWSFETEPVGLAISNVTATASSSAPGQGLASAVVDGSGLTDDLHSTDIQTIWTSEVGAPQPTWIQFEFDRLYVLHEMWVWNSNTELELSLGYGFKEVVIEYSLDGVNYETLGTTHEFVRAPGADGYAHNTEIDFGGVQAKYVKLTVNTNWAPFPLPQFGLSEVRFFHIPMRARKPQPESGATEVPVDVTVSWRAGRQAAEHNLYMSADEQAVSDGTADVHILTEANYNPSFLELETTYYWRIDESNDLETPAMWYGDVFSFTTTDFISVDDFEDYDVGNNEIWWIWKDGLGYVAHDNEPAYPGNGSGSAVGDENSPSYMEETIVHGGNKSLPFYYGLNNASDSWATRSFDEPQDWTDHAIEILSLWFYGDPANVPGQLYVKINGTKVDYNGSASNLALPAWQVWNIDLASTGANLQSVTSLSIGIEGASATGSLLFDDIELRRVALAPINEWRIATDDDDAEEEIPGGGMDIGSSDLELGYDGGTTLQTVGCRWVSVPIPSGVTITEAWVQFSADDIDNPYHIPDVSVVIEGELSGSPATFSDTAGDISSRPRTSASVVWDIPQWTDTHAMGPEERTPDISSIIQEIVDQPGWAGQAIVLMFRDNPAKPSQGTREAESFDGVASEAPLLHISYQ